jgi:hypothetical protein
MPGAIILVAVLLVIPVVICMSGMIVAALLGWSLVADADARHDRY